jgi:DNA-binding HxlR family transcriptional regulator
MAAGYASNASTAHAEGGEVASIGEVLRLLSAGATGAILLALCEGPMQTKVLTHRVRGYTARTIYRYLPRLAELGAVERNDDPSGPARVVHTLNDNSGGELCALIDRFATASMAQLPDGEIEPGEWASLGLLADLWEVGVVEALSHGPTSPTELTRCVGAFSYHQLNRRASRFKASGFFCESQQSPRQRRCYALTRKARRTMALVVGLGRWRQRRLAADGGVGLTLDEMATALRTALPLARVPQHAGKEVGFRIAGRAEGEEVRVDVAADGSLRCKRATPSRLDAWVAGDVEEWMAVLLDRSPSVEAGGDSIVVEDCLASLFEELWAPSPS